MQVRLQNVSEYASDFRYHYGDELAEDILASEGEEVTILGEATDCYWDIRLPSGREVSAITWRCLEGFKASSTEVVKTIRTIEL